MIETVYQNQGDEKVTVFILTVCIVLLALIVGFIGLKIPKKRKISKEQYRILYTFGECEILLRKKNWYLKEFEGDSDYPKLKNLFDDLSNFQKGYAKAAMNTPIILKKPHSPYSAAYVGTKVGGTAVGIVAAEQAKEKQIAYEQSLKAVCSADSEKRHSINRIENCCGTILKIIRKKEHLKNDWNKEKNTIKSNLEEEYKII